MYRIAKELRRHVYFWALMVPFHVVRSFLRNAGLIKVNEIAQEPWLPPAAKAKWLEEITRCKTYLEFGAGGSTLTALRTGVKTIVSVETDAAFLRKVVKTAGQKAGFYPLHVNIGVTRRWGRPLFRGQTRSRLLRWERYIKAPWELLARLGQVPDLVMIDGRFRVACVLETLLRLPQGAGTIILVDDFVPRRQIYCDILRFVTDATFYDDMLACRPPRHLDRAACLKFLAKYRCDPE